MYFFIFYCRYFNYNFYSTLSYIKMIEKWIYWMLDIIFILKIVYAINKGTLQLFCPFAI